MRKKKHCTDRMRRLSSIIFTDFEEIGKNPGLPFATEKPLRLEIGCGKGEFVRSLSKAEPDYSYYAMEKVDDVIVVAAEKYAEDRGLGTLGHNGGFVTADGHLYKDDEVPVFTPEEAGNVRFLSGDAAVLGEIFPENTFEHIYANFSDPWTKSGYAARRLTHDSFLETYYKLLIPGGKFTFKTDNETLFDFSLECIERSELKLVFSTRDLHNSERAETNIMTEYERNFSEQGIPIKCLEAEKPL